MKAFYADKIITEKGIEEDKYLLVEDGKIQAVPEKLTGKVQLTKFENCIIAPGYIDIHTHGALGYEPGYGDQQELKKWCDFKLKHGVTGFLPSTASIPLNRIKKAADNIKSVMKGYEKSNLLGMQMEGPFFSTGAKIGAQNPEYVQNNFSQSYQKFMEEYSNIISYLAIDPLVNDSRKIVNFCVEKNIKVSAAHSEILYENFLSRKQEGYSCITHSFNGMRGLHHRKPGLAYAACMDEDLFSEIICDGFHVIYPMLSLFFKLKGYDKSILVTDSMVATGMAPGTSYKLGDIEVTVNKEGKVYKKDGTLAGSTLTLDKAVQNIVSNLEVPLERAVQMASLNPARLLEIDNNKGSIEPGKDADFIVLEKNLSVKKTYLSGQEVG